MSALIFIFATIASILVNVVANLFQEWLETKGFGKLDKFKRLLITLVVFLLFYLLSLIDWPNGGNQTLTEQQKSLAETQIALANEQAKIRGFLTATAQVGQGEIINLSIEATGTAIAKQINSYPITQTAISSLGRFVVIAKVDPNLPVSSLNVRTSPIIIDNPSNVVGWLYPGDTVIITAWTNYPWTWCLINVPGNDKLQNVWVSNYVTVNKQTQETLVLEGLENLPSVLYINYSSQTHPQP